MKKTGDISQIPKEWTMHSENVWPRLQAPFTIQLRLSAKILSTLPLLHFGPPLPAPIRINDLNDVTMKALRFSSESKKQTFGYLKTIW